MLGTGENGTWSKLTVLGECKRSDWVKVNGQMIESRRSRMKVDSLKHYYRQNSLHLKELPLCNFHIWHFFGQFDLVKYRSVPEELIENQLSWFPCSEFIVSTLWSCFWSSESVNSPEIFYLPVQIDHTTYIICTFNINL